MLHGVKDDEGAAVQERHAESDLQLLKEVVEGARDTEDVQHLGIRNGEVDQEVRRVLALGEPACKRRLSDAARAVDEDGSAAAGLRLPLKEALEGALLQE